MANKKIGDLDVQATLEALAKIEIETVAGVSGYATVTTLAAAIDAIGGFANVASAGTISLGDGGYFNITGTTTITDIDFATDSAGRKAWVKFAGILTLTNGANLILPTGANITTAAGDTACFVSEGSDVIRCVAYHRANGTALAGSTSGAIISSGLTMATNRLLGRNTASVGAIEEITLGSNISMSGTTLNVSGGGGIGFEYGAPNVPLVSTFTWANQDTSTATDDIGAIVLKPQVNGELHTLYKSAPSYPYDLYFRARNSWFSSASSSSTIGAFCGIVLRDSSDGEQLACVIAQTRTSGVPYYQAEISRWSSTGTFVSTPVTLYLSSEILWVKVNVTSTTVTMFVSYDGKNFFQIGQELLSSYLDNADQIGIGAYATANATTQIAQISYFATTPPA
jgi:hypothetical protein